MLASWWHYHLVTLPVLLHANVFSYYLVRVITILVRLSALLPSSDTEKYSFCFRGHQEVDLFTPQKGPGPLQSLLVQIRTAAGCSKKTTSSQLLFLNHIHPSRWRDVVSVRLAWFVLLLPVPICCNYCKSGIFAQYPAALNNNPTAAMHTDDNRLLGPLLSRRLLKASCI